MLAAVLLAGCSVPDLEKFARENESASVRGGVSQRTLDGRTGQYIGFDSVITGGIVRFGNATTEVFARILVGPGEAVRFERPVAVGGTGKMLYIVDAGPRIVYRYDLESKEIFPINAIGPQFAGEPGQILVQPDESFFIIDSVGRKVLHFSAAGDLVQTYQDLANLARPIGMAFDERTNELLVADGSYSHIVVFNSFGKAVRAIGTRGSGPGRFRAITALAEGRDGFYIADRLEIPVQVLGFDGVFRYSFGEGQVSYPAAIAVDEDNRVYLADKSDHSLRIYRDGVLLEKYGGAGAAPGRFREVTGLWLNQGVLYVADSLNRRVHVLRVVNEGLGAGF